MADFQLDPTTAALKLGLERWNELAAMDNSLDVRRAVYNLTEQELRGIVFQRVANFAEQRLSPDDYGAWWVDPQPSEEQ